MRLQKSVEPLEQAIQAYCILDIHKFNTIKPEAQTNGVRLNGIFGNWNEGLPNQHATLSKGKGKGKGKGKDLAHVCNFTSWVSLI